MAPNNKKKPKKKAAPKKIPPSPSALAPVGSWQDRKPDTVPFAPYTPPADKLSVSPFSPRPKFDPEKSFLKVFKSLICQHPSYEIWNDFIVMSACAISNSVDKYHCMDREKRYLSIVKKYNRDEQDKFVELFAQMVMALELNPEQDFLGMLYASLNLHNEAQKQYFTPYNVCQLMSEITMDQVAERIEEKGYMLLKDPCCGAGATLIAGIHSAKKYLSQMSLNFQNHIFVVAQDINEITALMCYIQLSMLGMAAHVKAGNSLATPTNPDDEKKNDWFTPMYYSNVWGLRRIFLALDNLLTPPPSAPVSEKESYKFRFEFEREECFCSISRFYNMVAERAGYDLRGKLTFDPSKILCTAGVKDMLLKFHCADGGNNLSAAMMWANIGPKATLDGDKYAVEIQDGFIEQEA